MTTPDDTSPQPVVVSHLNGIPVVELPDHRALGVKGQALVDEILRQISDGNLPTASKELAARATGAAVVQRGYAEEHDDELDETRQWLTVPDEAAPTDVLNLIKKLAALIRGNAAHKSAPVIGAGAADSGVSAAVTGTSVITSQAVGSGDDWEPGQGATKIATIVETNYPDPGHPVRRMWRGLEERFFGE